MRVDASTPALHARVLGAGVAGLAAAHALAAHGHRVELIDESFSVPEVGTSLGLFGPARRALDRLGLLEAVTARSARPRAGVLVGREGRVLARVPAGDTLLVPRSDLVRVLRDTLPDAVERRTARIEEVEELRAGADLLVGADGVRSAVRRRFWPGDQRPRSLGMTVLRGTAEIAPPEISETWGGGWLFGITPLPGDRTNWFACLPEHRTPSREEDLAHLRGMVGGHRPGIDAVLDAATPGATLVHGIHVAPPLRSPVRGPVVLIGDAAHAMAPNLGHGANTALVDALDLAERLGAVGHRDGSGREGGGADVAAALRAHARRRGPAGQAWRLGSSLMARTAMAGGAPARLRDGALGALGTVTGVRRSSARAS